MSNPRPFRQSLASLAIALSLAATAPISTAAAQQPGFTAIKTDSDKDWEHKGSGIVLPAMIDGVARRDVRQLGDTQTDIMITYQDQATSTTTSIYIFHAAVPSVPLWFDTARFAMTSQNYFGTLTPLVDEAPLMLPGSDRPVGLRSVFTPGVPNFTSTGVAMAGAKGWIVKIRMSSSKLGAEALDARIGSTMAALNLPAPSADTPMAAIKPCASALSFSGTANKVKADTADALLGGLLGAFSGPVAAKDGEKSLIDPTPTAVYCRDPGANDFPVYRADESTSSYVMVMGDAGRAVTVNPQIDLAIRTRGTDADNFAVRGVLPDRSFTFPSLDRLPSPAQLREHVSKEKPISVSITAGPKAGTIEIVSP